MSTAAEELNTLKVRLSKHPKQGADKLTLIDHTSGARQSCTLAEGIPFLANLVEKNQGAHVIHVVDHKKERTRKLTNPDGTTKRIFNCRTPEQWKELNVALEPYYEEAVDPHIAIDLIIKALGAFTRETIRGWVKDGNGAGPGPPPSERIPGDEWFHAHSHNLPTDERADDDIPDALKD